MPAYATREEFKVLQSEVEGEKLITRYILEQTRQNSADLATLIRKVDGLDSRVGSLETRVENLATKVGAIDAKLTGLIHNLPAMIAAAMREVLKERREKNRRVSELATQ